MKKIKQISMKAAVLFKTKKPLKIIKIDLPNYLLNGQVLVKLHYSGICGSQIGEIDAIKGKDKYLPHLLGHEGSGTVIEIGQNVRTVKPKDKVILHWRPGLGKQSKPPLYSYKGKKINAGWITTFNEYGIISENRLTKVNSKINLITAPLYGCAITTGFGVIKNNQKLKKNNSVIIYGAGGIGLNMIQAAKLAKAKPIIAVDIHEKKLILAKKCGATHTINSLKEKNFKEKITKILQEKKLDVFIDNTGIPKVIELGYEIISKNGKLVLVGVPGKGKKIRIYSLPIHFGKKIIGSEGGSSKPNKDIPNILNIIKSKKINLKQLISKTYRLDKINEAIKDIRSGAIRGRAMIKL
jgi:S-(hydroxymethyl)glutathione dehydrogenase/alcohol dehydrogenase